MKKSDISKLITSVIGCELVGILSTPFTISAIPTWYATLNKPVFSPPNWLFGPVWTALYFSMGVSLFLIWRQGLKNKAVKYAVKVFLIQLVVNFLWSILFFGLQSPLLGLIDIVLMFGLIIYSIKLFYPISKIAAYLLVPYLFWVSFASVLNLFIVILN